MAASGVMPPYPERFHVAAAYAGISTAAGGKDGAAAASGKAAGGGGGPAMTDETRLLLHSLFQQEKENGTAMLRFD
eukprot:jgi/Chlat1/255/Chrsp1S08779